MRPSELLNHHREAIRRIVRLHGACNPRVFGTAARGEDTEGSDLDIVIDRMPGHRFTLFNLGAIDYELTECLGISVDVLTPGFLPEKFREQVLREAKPI